MHGNSGGLHARTWSWAGASTRRDRTRAARRRRLTLERCEERALLSTLTVTNLNDHGAGSLRAQLFHSHEGDLIVFRPGLAGTIALQGELLVTKGVDVEGPGNPSQIVVSGGRAVRAFHVTAAATSGVTIANLTIAAGRAPIGAGLLDEGATVNLNGDVVRDNAAIGVAPDGAGVGGGAAVTNGGTLNVSDSFSARGFYIPTFRGNIARGAAGSLRPGADFGDAGGEGDGGGIAIEAGSTLNVDFGLFQSNAAYGGRGGPEGGEGGFGQGGAIFAGGGGTTVSLSNTTLQGNTAVGGQSGNRTRPGVEYVFGSIGSGGGLASVENGLSSTVTLSQVSLLSNTAIGGQIGTAAGRFQELSGLAYGGGAVVIGGTLNVDGSRFVGNSALGADAPAAAAGQSGSENQIGFGSAHGGGLYASVDSLGLTSTEFSSNLARGSSGGDGGAGGGGANGGQAFGGGAELSINTTAAIFNDVFAFNTTMGGRGGGGGQGGLGGDGGSASGGGLFAQFSPFRDNGGTFDVGDTGFDNNTVQGGDAGYSVLTNFTQRGGDADSGGAAFRGGPTPYTLTNVQAVGNFVGGGFGYAGVSGPVNAGGNAFGGGLSVAGADVTMTGLQVLNNLIEGGSAAPTFFGGPLRGGFAFGGGLYVGFPASFTPTVATIIDGAITGNQAFGEPGRGGGVYVQPANSYFPRQPGATLYRRNTKIAGNTASTDHPNVFGNVVPLP